MVKGRLPRESNPVPGQQRGFVSSFDKTGNEDYVRVSPDNPLPTADYGMTESGVWIPKKVSDDGAQHTQLTGSIEGLSTDDKPEVIEGYSYLEYDVEAQEMNVYKGISGEWRLM